MNLDELLCAIRVDGQVLLKLDPCRTAPATFEPPFAAGAFDQDPPHRLGRGGEEVAATVPC